ncbi:MAG: hypothetical protein HC888_06615, partial [Candidatus Competibacteraceae bacterium]|nr:hypothetical protein [Candidatus Competibacteraceae bacterium]
MLALAKPKEVDVSAHIDLATSLLWVALALVLGFFVLRPELWRRLWFQRIDARGPALARIALGLTVVWTFVDLLVLSGEWLFTDQGMLLTDMARKNYGGKLRTLWDPVHGFEHWYDPLLVLTDRWSVLFIRSDPPFVYTIFGLLFASGLLMTIGLFTRINTFLTWLLMLQLYNYNPIYYTGGDTVMRVMMFLGMFVDWGQAYSVDAWRARRKAILSGAEQFPALQRIPRVAGAPDDDPAGVHLLRDRPAQERQDVGERQRALLRAQPRSLLSDPRLHALRVGRPALHHARDDGRRALVGGAVSVGVHRRDPARLRSRQAGRHVDRAGPALDAVRARLGRLDPRGLDGADVGAGVPV